MGSLSRSGAPSRSVWRDEREPRCPLTTEAQTKWWAEAADLSREPVKTASARQDRLSDGELLARTAAGDRSAFRQLHRRYEAYVFWLARRVLGQAAEAEDAVQEAWIKVFSRARQGVPAERVRAWLRTVVVRCCIDVHRRDRRVARLADAEAFLPDGAAVSGPALRMDLERALAALSWDLRTVVVLHDVEGLSHGEVGEVLQISEQASRSRLSRARRRLRIQLRKS